MRRITPESWDNASIIYEQLTATIKRTKWIYEPVQEINRFTLLWIQVAKPLQEILFLKQ